MYRSHLLDQGHQAVGKFGDTQKNMGYCKCSRNLILSTSQGGCVGKEGECSLKGEASKRDM